MVLAAILNMRILKIFQIFNFYEFKFVYFHFKFHRNQTKIYGFDCFTQGIEANTLENKTFREMHYEFVYIANILDNKYTNPTYVCVQIRLSTTVNLLTIT